MSERVIARLAVWFGDWVEDWLLGPQSAFAGAGPHARTLDSLHWLLAGVCAFVFVLFMTILLLAWRARGRQLGSWVIWGGGIVFTSLVLGLFLGATVHAMRSVAALDSPDALEIHVAGRQYWWDVEYPADGDAPALRTANEIHLPVGRPVRFLLTSPDVIHSFWVPSLGGKIDMVPGRTNVLVLRADRPGRYRGQCAEFCGEQHARMAFEVVVHEPEAFERWRTRLATPAPEPTDAWLARGRDAFIEQGCASCHDVRGVSEGARLGPDLTAFGSRALLGAGMWPNNAGWRAGWIANAQGIKPGVLMPAFVGMDGPTLRAMNDWLGSLE